MKKIVCMLLVLTLIFSLTAAVYAAPTAGDLAYDEEEIIDEDVAQGGAEGDSGTGSGTLDVDTGNEASDTDTRTITDEAAPGGSVKKLPKTGGIPAELFYVVGGLLIVSALLLTVKKSKASAKG